MLNMMRADLYRIFRGKGIYITSGIFLALIILQSIVSGVGHVGVNLGDASPVEAVQLTGKTAPFFMMGSADNIVYFTLALIIFIASADFSSGTVKNVLTSGISRMKYYFSKTILASALCFLLLLINLLVPILLVTLLNGFGGTFNMEFVTDVLKAFLPQLYLCISVTCVGIFLVFVTKKTAAVNALYIAFCLVPTLLIYMLVELNSSFEKWMDYDLIANIKMLADVDTLSASDMIRALVIGTVYILLSTIGGAAIFRKSDIK